MRARYYSPALRRFINADIIPGEISNSVTLNRYAYANGNPVSNIDPFGLSAEDRNSSATSLQSFWEKVQKIILMIQQSGKSSHKISSEDIAEFIQFLTDIQVVTISGISKKMHYDRLNYTLDYPLVFSEELTDVGGFYHDWNSEVLANCHQFTAPNKDNFKLVSPDGRYEVIYDGNNNRVDDIRDIGTYNYASPNDDALGHLQKDVLPWIFWGNSPDDTTTVYERIDAMLGGTLSTIESISAETVKSNMNNTLSGPPQLIPFSN